MSGALRRAGLGALVLCAGLSCGVTNAQPAGSAAAPPPLDAFGRLPAAQHVTLSPNGKLLAMEEEQGGTRKVVIFEADGGKSRHSVEIDEANKLRDVLWGDDETLLIDLSQQKKMYCNPNVLCQYEWFRTLAVRMDGSPPRMLLNDDERRKYVTASSLLAARTTRPGTVTMETIDRAGHKWGSVVFEVDTRTGKEKMLANGTYATNDWVVDSSGAPVARSDWSSEPDLFRIYVRGEGDRWQEIFRLTDGTKLDLHGLDPAGKAIIAIGTNGTDRAQAWSIPLDGSAVTSVASHPELDIDVVLYDSNRHVVVGVRSTDSKETHWFDPKLAAQQKALEKAFAGRNVHVLDRSVIGRRVLVAVEHTSHPPVYQLVDFDQGRADVVAEAYPAIDPATLGSVSYIRYLARDGQSIPAYLTLPPGRTAKDLPLVILPHGGPMLRDKPEFDWLSQFLATRGYAVLQPQFRGSTGYGEAFRKAGIKQWGGLMQDDVTDGVRHLIATGVANPDRVCIVGASYGGYAALAGAAFTPDLYACAASINGVSDLPSMIGDRRKKYGSGSLDYWNEHVGSATDPNTEAKSPARSAAKVRAPVLLLHGVDDVVVPYQQSKTMERELLAAGKPVKFVTLDGEDHWLSRSGTRMRVLQELDVFLAKYLR